MAGGTRDLIIQATEKLIKMKGLSRVTTKEIARATNLSEGALYRHFERKEDVFFALLTVYLPPFLETFQPSIAGERSVQEQLVAIVQAAMNVYEALMPMGAAFFSDTELLLQFREKMLQNGEGPLNIHILVAAYIEEEQQLGRISQRLAPLTIAIQLLGPCFQYVFFRQLMGKNPWDKTKEQFAEDQVEALLPMLLP